MRYRNSLSINFWNMLLQVKEICSRICCFLKKNTAIDVPPEIEKLYHTFVSSSSNNGKCAILSLVPNSYSKNRNHEVIQLFKVSP